MNISEKRFLFFSFFILLQASFFSTNMYCQHRRNYKVNKKRTFSTNILAEGISSRRAIAAIDSFLMKREIFREGVHSASSVSNLYTSWNNRYVNPYGKERDEVPDRVDIDISKFVMPVRGGRVSSHFGQRWNRMHYGTDIAVQTGDTVRAAFSGKVRIRYYEAGGYGYCLVIRHYNGLETVYGHLSKFLVNLDQNVRAGQAIALSGSTGRSTGPHLHFETRLVGIPINPENMIDFNRGKIRSRIYSFNKDNWEERKVIRFISETK